MIDESLLQRALDYITAHPEEWDQKSWGVKSSCGTKFCLAGTILVLCGYQFLWEEIDDEDTDVLMTLKALDNGRFRTIRDIAIEKLGIEHTDNYELFWFLNSLDDLWRIAGKLTDSRVHRRIDAFS